MPAIALVVAAVASSAGITAAIGAAVAEVIGAGIVADVVTGTIIGAGTGAVSSAIQGGDIAEGALIGGVTGGVGAGLTSGISGAMSTPGPGQYGPQLFTGSPGMDYGLAKGLSGVVTGALGSGLRGGDPLTGSLTSGLSGFVSGATQPSLGSDTSRLLGGATSMALGQAFAPDAPTRRAVSSTIGPTTYNQPTITGKTATTQSTAPLGGALLASPTLGYTPGSSFLGGTDSQKPAQNVWNQASLKEGAPVGPSSDGTQTQSS